MNDGAHVPRQSPLMNRRFYRGSDEDVRAARKALDEALERLHELRKLKLFPF